MSRVYPWKMAHNVSPLMYRALKAHEFLSSLADGLVEPLKSELTFGFIVGCGHSGTTLLAAKLGNHPAVHTIPRETRAFFPRRGMYRAEREVKEWMASARVGEKRCIIEKSPKHVHAVLRIRRLLPESRIIMISRNPLDACASLFKRFESLSLAVERWNMDNIALLEHASLNNSLRLTFEDLTQKPAETLQQACSFLGLSWDESILKAGRTVYDSARQAGNMEIRREQVQAEIRPNLDGWKQVFSPEQADYVRSETAGVAERLGYLC